MGCARFLKNFLFSMNFLFLCRQTRKMTAFFDEVGALMQNVVD